MDLKDINSSDLSVEKLFVDFYVVPNYQREYVWGAEEVEQLLQDINSEFAEKTRTVTPDYFIGTIVTNHQVDKGVYELIDGQQRVTTLYVILCAIRDYMIELRNPIASIDPQLIFMASDDDGREHPAHRVVLNYDDNQEVLTKLAKSRADLPLDEIGVTSRSALNLVQAYLDTRAFLAEDLGGNPKRIREFWAFITKHVKLIRIVTTSLGRALWIFETINHRGKGLDAMDLLKNLLFRSANDDQYELLKRRWKAIVQTLYEVNENPMRFIRYYLLANHAKGRIQADHVYDWLTNPNNRDRPNYWDDPLAFTNTLLSAAKAYANLVGGKLEDGTECRYLSNMWHLSHSARQHLILMLASRNLPSASSELLAGEIENLYFVFLVTGQSANRFEKDFVDWAVKLRVMKSPTELREFLDHTLIPERTALSGKFRYALENLGEGDLPKYRMKYVLAKLAQYLDEIAYGTTQLGAYINRKVDLEHIFPLSAPPDLAATFGTAEQLQAARHSLANLTLLERSINSSIAAKCFSDKSEEYAKSRFILTKALTRRSRMGGDTSINRALDQLTPFESWTYEDWLVRRGDLLRLASSVWSTPVGSD